MSQTTDLATLLQSAGEDGILSASTMGNIAVLDLNAQLHAGMGISADDVRASEVFIVTLEPDDSGSIRFAGNAKVVCDGHNLVVDALLASKQRNDTLFGTRYLNGTVLNPYCLIDKVIRMDNSNYNPNGGTPLYEQTFLLLTGVVAKTAEFESKGVRVRTQTLIISDGADTGGKFKAHHVRDLVRDMLQTENHIVAAMGIDDGSTDFRAVFAEMGIPDEWILTPGNTESEIRKAFGTFSQSAVRASQGAASFSQALGGGFTNP